MSQYYELIKSWITNKQYYEIINIEKAARSYSQFASLQHKQKFYLTTKNEILQDGWFLETVLNESLNLLL